MDRLSPTDLIDATWRLRAAWRRLHPDLGDDEMPETIRNSEPNRLQSILSALRFLIEGTEADLATAPPEPSPPTVDLSTFAGMDGKRQRGKGKLFIDLRRFAEAPEWVQVIPKPAAFEHDWYGTILITAERNARFVQNFTDAVYQVELPVDAEHETKLSGAFGWIKDLRLNDDQSVSARIEWTARGILAFEQESFKYLSPEWFDWWEQPMTSVVYYDVLIGLALCNRPFFKESSLEPLFPLVASENGLTAPEGASPLATAGPAVLPTPIAASEPTEGEPMEPQTTPEKIENAPQSVTLTEEQARQFADWQTQRQEFSTKLAAQESQITQLSERNTALETANAAATTTAMTKRFTDEVRGRSDANPNPWLGEIEGNVNALVEMAEKLGEDSPTFQFHLTNQRGIAAQAKANKLFSSIGSSEGGETATAADQLEAKARIFAEAHNVTFASAMVSVAEQNPDLYRQHRAESRAR